jgi:hypothetical protein
MQHKNKIFKNLINFLQSKEKFAILVGKDEKDAHSIALAALLVCFFEQKKNILFRTSSVKDIEIYLSEALSGFWDGDPGDNKFRKRIKEAFKNRYFSIATMNIFIDTTNPRSQIITPQKLHGAIVYPVENFLSQNGIFEKCLRDLQERDTEKVIFCTSIYEEKLEGLKVLKPVIMNDVEEPVWKNSAFKDISEYGNLACSCF